MKRIEVIVSPDGSTKVETKGFTGSTCQQASEFLERSLGQKRSDHRTADFYRTEASQTQQARQQSS
ncbi:DUF2997 domain-containing protein [Novipirellula artificiosorum]|uniref:DUF2997 domain-containing protein n=1 Tax=Novipirellula artificiosorum TaxID=2528016 RepID=A0A5C6DBQ8_9BACT|nr:DUF2997 domain-containing protein [Novipirellula artificiosorum]TWU33217.1 hypothetical protein Poly41_49690 [Novipirellula artificiosorum]